MAQIVYFEITINNLNKWYIQREKKMFFFFFNLLFMIIIEKSDWAASANCIQHFTIFLAGFIKKTTIKDCISYFHD